MLLSELIELLSRAIDIYGDLYILMEDYEIGNLMDLHSVKIVEYEGDDYVLLSDKTDKNSIEISYLN